MGKLFRPALILFLILSLLVLWGMSELLTTEERGGAVSPGLQVVAFALISMMTVIMLTVFIGSRKKGDMSKDDDR